MDRLKQLTSFKGVMSRKDFFITFLPLIVLFFVGMTVYTSSYFIFFLKNLPLYPLLTSCIKRSRDIGWNEMIGVLAWLPFAFDIDFGSLGGLIPLPIGFLFLLVVPLLFLESSFRSKKNNE